MAQMDLLAGAPWRRHALVANPNLFGGLTAYLTRGQFLRRLSRVVFLVHVSVDPSMKGKAILIE